MNVHEKFVRDELPVIVATVAFGMGIDKPGKIEIFLLFLPIKKSVTMQIYLLACFKK